jgi:glycosyltransferase involved in cell wall biosynthesis
MHALILTSNPPYPPQQGGALRVYGIVRGLHKQGHRVTLACFIDAETPESYAPLRALCDELITVPAPRRTKQERVRDLALTNRPDIAERLSSDAMREKLRDLITRTEFDVIQFEGIEMVIYLPFVHTLKQHGFTHAALIYDSFNAESQLQRLIARVESQTFRRLPMAVYSHIQAARIARFEAHICQLANAVIAVSDEDAAILRTWRRDNHVYVVPNGIHTEDYIQHPQKLALGEHVLVFTGKMDYRPNVDAMLWFAADIFPAIAAAVPDVRLVIVGQKPHPSLESLRARPNISITGWVQAVQPYLHAASVYIAPLRMGSGTRLKILEAMASGCAVVATHTAASGLSASVRDAMILADTDSATIDAIVRLLHHPAERAQLGVMAQQRVREGYDWDILIPCLLGIYKDIGLG